MKKIIAMIAALSMVASIGLTCVSAAEPDDLTMSCDVVELTDSEYEEIFEEEPGDNVGYTLTFTIEGIEDDEVAWTRGGKSGAYTYTGRSIDSFSLKLNSDVDKENFVSAFTSEDAAFSSETGIVSTVANRLTMENAGARMIPSGTKNGSFDATEPIVVIYVAIPKGVEMNLTPQGTIKINNWEGAAQFASADVYTNETGSNLLFDPAVITLGESAPATVDVTSVTISGATAATVGDNVSLTATVLPDNATDKTVTWTKVSGNGAVSSSGVVTATAAGDVVVKATAGGVDSANYTVSFAAAAPADIVPAAADKDTYSNASTGLKDAFGKDVTIDSSRSYGAAKFDNVVLDDGEYVYKVFATGINKATGLEETKSWDVVDGSVEITGANVSFIAIVRSATHTITSVVLKAFAK